MKVHNDRNCSICGSKEKYLLLQQNFTRISDINLVDHYDINVCKDCGFCFADKIPEQDDFDRYYKEMSKYEKFDLNAKESASDVKRFKAVVTYIEEVLENKSAKIVEIGCANGLLLSMLKDNDYDNLLGVDPSPVCVDTAIKKYKIPAVTGTLANISVEDESVDCLILVGVLEHVRDLNESLIRLHKLLKNRGKLIIGVPDASKYFEGKDAPFQEFSLEHINFFGPGSLVNLVKQNGFSVINLNQVLLEVNSNTYVPVILSTFIKENDSAIDNQVIEDRITIKNLKQYIKKSDNHEKRILRKISTIIQNQEPVLIWGTGALTLRLLGNTELCKANICAFVDSNPKYQGRSINRVPIISPNSLIGRNEVILISTWAFQNEIELQIKNVLKLKNRIIKLY